MIKLIYFFLALSLYIYFIRDRPTPEPLTLPANLSPALHLALAKLHCPAGQHPVEDYYLKSSPKDEEGPIQVCRELAK